MKHAAIKKGAARNPGGIRVAFGAASLVAVENSPIFRPGLKP
jgi:hypothetical protein